MSNQKYFQVGSPIAGTGESHTSPASSRSKAKQSRSTLGVLPFWKRIHRLTEVEFRDCPIWALERRPADPLVPDDDATVYHAGERLVEFVRPLPGVFDLDDSATYIVATEFHMVGGARGFGYSSPWYSPGIDFTQPVMLTSRGLVRLWYHWQPEWSEPRRSLERLDKSASDVFPLKIMALIPGQRGPYSETVERISGKFL